MPVRVPQIRIETTHEDDMQYCPTDGRVSTDGFKQG
jgi:hypothetical protein